MVANTNKFLVGLAACLVSTSIYAQQVGEVCYEPKSIPLDDAAASIFSVEIIDPGQAIQPQHVGNATLVDVYDSSSLFITAGHVLYSACEALVLGQNLKIRLTSVGNNVSGNKNIAAFRIDDEQCKLGLALGAEPLIDIGFFSADNNYFGAFFKPHAVPLHDPNLHNISDLEILGYQSNHQSTMQPVSLLDIGDVSASGIFVQADRGWSGMPLLRKFEGNKVGMLGLVFETNLVLRAAAHLNNKPSEDINDRKIALIAASVIKKAAEDKQTLIVRIGQANPPEWASGNNDTIDLISTYVKTNRIFSAKDSDSITEYLKRLSPIEQFYTTGYVEGLNNVNNWAGLRDVNIALLQSLTFWCYHDRVFHKKIVNQLKNSNLAYNRAEKKQLIKLVASVQNGLIQAYRTPREQQSKAILVEADNALSLLFDSDNPQKLRTELVSDDSFSPEYLAATVYEHGRVVQAIGDNEDKAINLYETALSEDKSHLNAKLAVTDIYTKQGDKLPQAISNYELLLEELSEIPNARQKVVSNIEKSLALAKTKMGLATEVILAEKE